VARKRRRLVDPATNQTELRARARATGERSRRHLVTHADIDNVGASLRWPTGTGAEGWGRAGDEVEGTSVFGHNRRRIDGLPRTDPRRTPVRLGGRGSPVAGNCLRGDRRSGQLRGGATCVPLRAAELFGRRFVSRGRLKRRTCPAEGLGWTCCNSMRAPIRHGLWPETIRVPGHGPNDHVRGRELCSRKPVSLRERRTCSDSFKGTPCVAAGTHDVLPSDGELGGTPSAVMEEWWTEALRVGPQFQDAGFEDTRTLRSAPKAPGPTS